MTYHYFCNNCCKKIVSEVACCHCGNNTSVFQNRNCYFEFSLINQVLCFFKRPGFYEKLKYRFNRNCDSNNLYDIHDGDIYKKKHCDSGSQLADLNNISFVLNTDGVPIFKSSNISIRPAFFVINEVESNLRYQSENMLFTGLWYSSKKLEASLFFEPLYKERRTLEKGIEVQIYANVDFIKIICRLILLAGTFDLPAPSLVTDTVQCNGKYDCIKYYQEGKSCKTEKTGNVWVYQYAVEDPKGPQRTNKSFRKDALNACKENKTVNGVKSLIWLNFFLNFDLLNGIAIDYMHGIGLGVMKLLMKSWFSKSF